MTPQKYIQPPSMDKKKMLFINRVILTWMIFLLQTSIFILKNKGNAQTIEFYVQIHKNDLSYKTIYSQKKIV